MFPQWSQNSVFFPQTSRWRPCTCCASRDIPSLPVQTQIYLCTLLVESLHLPCTPMESGKVLGYRTSWLKLLGFNRQDRDSITPNGQYTSSSIKWPCSFITVQALLHRMGDGKLGLLELWQGWSDKNLCGENRKQGERKHFCCVLSEKKSRHCR